LEARIVEFERDEAEGEDVVLVLADRLIVPLAPLYCRAACYGGEDRAEQKVVRSLAAMTNRTTGLLGLGPAPHVPARGQAYSAWTTARLGARPKAIENHGSSRSERNEPQGGSLNRVVAMVPSIPSRANRSSRGRAGGRVGIRGKRGGASRRGSQIQALPDDSRAAAAHRDRTGGGSGGRLPRRRDARPGAAGTQDCG